MNNPTRIGLALGSGAAKGFAHIGVLRALNEAGIEVHAVAGSSMGSLVGALYAAGVPVPYMEALALSLKRRHWLDFTVPKMGFVSGERVRELVRLMTRNRTIDELPFPLAVVATELISRQLVVFTSGSVADAVRASISIPGVFVPAVSGSQVYVDGGVLERVPVAGCRTLGVDFVIGVDVSATRSGVVPTSVLDVIMYSLDMMQDQVILSRQDTADFMIAPDVSRIGPGQFHRAKDAIDAGYNAAMACLPVLHRTLQAFNSRSLAESGSG